MAQTILYSYRTADSTFLFNENFRRIIPNGVYLGYDIQWTGAGWGLDIIHAADPDNAGATLGVLVTRDGAVCHEDADQINAIVGGAPAGVDEMHYVCASYVYNASTPPNAVNYIIRVVSPTGPYVPTVDEVLLASIFVPAAAGSYGAAGVTISNVAKQSLAYTNPAFALDGVLNPGIYEGISSYQGSAWNKVSLEAGYWVTKENWIVEEAAPIVDLPNITLTDPGVGLYRYVWLIGCHNYQDTDPVDDAEYIAVEGAAVAIGTTTTLPNDAAIMIAATAFDPKFTTDDHWNKLGYLRVERRGATYIINYYKGDAPIQEEMVVVHGGEATSLESKSGHYYGHEGLVQAVSDIHALLAERYDTVKPYTIFLDGEFKLADTPLYLPSMMVLEGKGAPAKLSSENNNVVKATGWRVDYDTINLVTTVNGFSAVPTQILGYAIPAGQEELDITIRNLGAYRAGDDLVAHRFCAGDSIFFYDHTGTTLYEGTFVAYHTVLDNWSFYCYMPVGWRAAGHDDTSVLVMKHDLGLRNVTVDCISAVNGIAALWYADRGVLEDVTAKGISLSIVRDCKFSFTALSTVVTAGYFQTVISTDNVFDRVELRGAVSPIAFGGNLYNSVFNYLYYHNTAVAMVLQVNTTNCTFDRVRVSGAGGSRINVDGGYNVFMNVYGDTRLTTGSSNYFARVDGAYTLDAGVWSNIAGYVGGAVTDNSADVTNKVHHTETSDIANEVLEHANSDRNLKMYSAGSFTWTASTNTLEWTDTVYFDLSYEDQLNSVAAAANTDLTTDGDRLYVTLDRGATVLLAVTKLAKISAFNLRRSKHAIFFALRRDDCIYLWDGTRIEDGQTVKLGTTPPPDGSVTYPKLYTATPGANSDPLAHFNRFFRDYVALTDNTGWDDDVVMRNTVLGVLAYVPITGAITYTNAPDFSVAKALCDAGVPLIVILRNAAGYTPGVSGFIREPIISIDDATDTVYIAKGLTFAAGLGGAHLWNGAIVRGAMVCTNDGLLGFSYDPILGRVTYGGGGMGFSNVQVQPGFIFLDAAGKKYEVLKVDPAGVGQWIEIAPGLRDVVTTPITTRFHGCIKTNNNPYNDVLADLRVSVGAEFIPIDSYGEIDIVTDDQVIKAYNNSPTAPSPNVITYFNGLERRFTTPYDSRIRVWIDPTLHTSIAGGVTDGNVYNFFGYGAQSIRIVEVTGVFSDIALVVTGGDSPAALGTAWIDGERYTTSSSVYTVQKDCDNTYGVDFNRYEVIGIHRAMRLSPEIHNVKIQIPTETVLKGIIVSCTRPGNNAMPRWVESPGTVVAKGGLLTLSNPDTSVAVAKCSTYNKGGRIVRYLDYTTGTRLTATTPVKSFTDTGTISIPNPLITAVGNTSLWRVGDLLLAVSAAGARWLHQITAINPGVSLTISPVGGFNGVGVTLRYYGHAYQPNTVVQSSLQREYEEVAFHYNTSEFFAPGPLDANLGSTGETGTLKSLIGTRLSDVSTALLCDGAVSFDFPQGGGLEITVAAAVMRIWFTGTGLSIRRTGTTANHLSVDGLAIAQIAASASEQDTDQGGTFICGDLPYGQHTVTITGLAGAPNFVLKSLTVWQPKKPTFTGFELLDVNQVADSELELIGLVTPIVNHQSVAIDGVDDFQFGTINMEAGSCCHAGTGALNVLRDVAGVAVDAIIARYHDLNTPAINDYLAWYFYGDEVTLVIGDSAPNVIGPPSSIEVAFLDRDHTWKAPSLLTGFAATFVPTPTALTGDTIDVSAVSARRLRYKLDTVGFHAIRVRVTDVLDTIQFDAIEVHPKFHNYKTKQPIATDHVLPFCFGGIDKRNLVPFNTELLPKIDYASVQSVAYVGAAPDIYTNLTPFAFYTRGGPTEISCVCLIDATGGAGTPGIVIDNIAYAAGATTGTGAVVFRVIVSLPPGFHTAYLLSSTVTNLISLVHWAAKEISHPNNAMVTRGFGRSNHGPGLLGDSMY